MTTRAARWSRIGGGLATSLAGGALCAWLGTPLPWMLGPLFAMAILRFSGLELEAPPYSRDAGQVVVGVMLGLYFTPAVVREVSAFGGYFVALGFAAIASGALCAWVLRRLTGVDAATAFFSSMPGGAPEMANLGRAHGALAGHIALAHGLRMLVVVTTVPIALTLAGFSGADDARQAAAHFEAPGFALLLGAGLAGGALAWRLRLPNAFMLGPLAVSIALTSSGVNLTSVPTVVSNAAQLILACSLGAHFRQSFLREAPRFVAAQLACVALILALSALVGAALSWASGAYAGAMLLAAAPGAIAEMSITAKVLKIGVAFVTAAHVVRYVIVVLFSGPAFRLAARAGARR